MRPLPALALLAACGPAAPGDDVTLGAWTLTVDRAAGALALAGPGGQRLDALRLAAGAGSQRVTFNFGAFLFEDVTTTWTEVTGFGDAAVDGDAVVLPLLAGEDVLGRLRLAPSPDEGLALHLVDVAIAASGTPRLRLSAACDADEHFLGLGSHAMDVDHVGQAFPLWVSEPGMGKTTTEEPAADWFLRGTRHASSYPVPFLLRPQQPSGLLVETEARVEVDLCATDPGRFEVVAWDHAPVVYLFAGERPLEVVERLTAVTGRPRRLPRWALAPWNDAITGRERVEEVVATLREAGAPTSVLWSEDWKGAIPNPTGYRLSEEWDVDEALYPDAVGLADHLADRGFRWFGYFAPFVGMDARSGQEASAADGLIRTADGDDYVFTSAAFRPASLVDLTTEAGRAWARGKMQAAVDLGFAGWMADFAEWLPHDAVLADGTVGLDVHNGYPLRWQRLNEEVLAPVDGVAFCRSGWVGTSGTCPVVWLGDQKTDFAPDDGLPTILPLALGLSASGVPVVTHDVAGYQSFETRPSDRELWLRWAALGAFSPILRTHHGSSAFDNHQFDSDEETLAAWAALSREHMRLFPYRDALARDAAERGRPMILPTSFVYAGEDWGRADAWLLGPSLLVAPVLERGADGREVALPAGAAWYDWWTGARATGGRVEAPLGSIPVFVAGGSTIPLFDVVPDTLADGHDDDLVGFDEADAARLVLLFAGGGPFTEGDGTTYAPSGAATADAEAVVTLREGEVTVGGVTLAIRGPRERRYTVRVVP